MQLCSNADDFELRNLIVSEQQCSDDLFVSDHPLWNRPDTRSTGQNPESRMGHTAVYDATMRCVYVFGGSKNLKWFNDVHLLDVDEWKWELVKVRTPLCWSGLFEKLDSFSGPGCFLCHDWLQFTVDVIVGERQGSVTRLSQRMCLPS